MHPELSKLIVLASKRRKCTKPTDNGGAYLHLDIIYEMKPPMGYKFYALEITLKDGNTLVWNSVNKRLGGASSNVSTKCPCYPKLIYKQIYLGS